MSLKLMTDVFESDLEPTRRLILLVYANFANDDGENSWPSIRTLVSMTGLGNRTIQMSIRTLADDHILVADGISKYRTNRFKIDRLALINYRRVQQMQGAAGAPPQQMHPEGAADAPMTPQQMHPKGAADAPNPLILNTDPSNTLDSVTLSKTIWATLLKTLQVECDRATYRTWLVPIDPLNWDGQVLTLAVANRMALDELNSHVATTINRDLPAITGAPGAHAQFIVRPPYHG